MAFSAGQILQKWFRQIIRWPLEALFGFGLFYFARLLPVRFASAAMGGLLGIAAPLTPWHRRALRNLNHAMPDLDDAEKDRILRAMWLNLGRVIGEYPHINSIVDKGWVAFVGLEHLMTLDRGASLIGAHIDHWAFCPLTACPTG